MTPASRHRLGLFALAAAGLLMLVGILMRGAMIDPTVDAAGFASAAAAASTAWTMILVGGVLCLFGLMALYALLANTRHERLAFAGFVASFAGLALVLPLFGFMAVAAPLVADAYAQGATTAMNVVTGYFSGTLGMTLLMASSLLYIAGGVCTAVALWRTGRAPWWVAAAFALHAPLVSLPMPFVVEILGAALMLATAAYLIWMGGAKEAAPVEAPAMSVEA